MSELMWFAIIMLGAVGVLFGIRTVAVLVLLSGVSVALFILSH